MKQGHKLVRKLIGQRVLSISTLIKRTTLLINLELWKMNAPLRRSTRLATKRVKKYEQWFKSRMMELPAELKARLPEHYSLLFSIMTSALNNLYRIRYNYETRRDVSESDFMIVKLYTCFTMIREIISLYQSYNCSRSDLLKTHAKFSEVIRNRLFIVEDMVEFIVNNKIAGVTYLDFGRGNLVENFKRIINKTYGVK
jgi:hypothetical protein